MSLVNHLEDPAPSRDLQHRLVVLAEGDIRDRDHRREHLHEGGVTTHQGHGREPRPQRRRRRRSRDRPAGSCRVRPGQGKRGPVLRLEKKIDVLATNPYHAAMTAGTRLLSDAAPARRRAEDRRDMLNQARQAFAEAIGHAHGRALETTRAEVMWRARLALPWARRWTGRRRLDGATGVCRWSRIDIPAKRPPGTRLGASTRRDFHQDRQRGLGSVIRAPGLDEHRASGWLRRSTTACGVCY